jgi:hypothetical protein
MSLIQAAQNDIKKITANLSEFALDVELIKPNGDIVEIKAIHTKHHVGLDSDGLAVNAKTASISFSEYNLPEGVSIRNAKNEVVLKNWKCNVIDSTGIVKNYIIREWFPDEMIGLIVCILGDFE